MARALSGGWVETQFKIARFNADPVTVNGVVHERGIGVHRIGAESWLIIHVRSGHAIVRIDLPEIEAIAVATEIAELGDWTFESLHGWENHQPLLPGKMQALVELYAPAVVIPGGRSNADDEQAAARVRGWTQ